MEEFLMKRFNITVNGTAYDVTVDEVAAGAAPAPAPKAAAPAPAPAAAPTPAPAAAPAKGEGAEVNAPMPGTILDVKVAQGATVKAGDVIVLSLIHIYSLDD